MRVFAISDLHLSFSSDKPMDIFGDSWTDYWAEIKADWKERVEADDIVLIAGDISWAMSLENAKIDFEELVKLSGRKVIVRGNHDYWWSSYKKVKDVLPPNFYAVQNNAVRIDNCLFCGTRGWNILSEASSEEDKKIYLREIERLKLSLADLDKKRGENDLVFGMIHYPPFNVKFEESEFTALFEKHKVNKVIYGHLHGKNCRTKLVVNRGDVDYFLTSCDQIGNKLIRLY